MNKGKVYLVGGGPGDVKLVTVKGKEVLGEADVIVYDRLVNPKLLDFAHSECEFIYGGKLPKRHVMRQEQLNDLLVSKAREGKVVVRLKGGDPSVFGRVGEEAEQLKSENIEFEIVPGITSGIAAPLYAGIPVTHREFGTSFTVVTAHGKAVNGQPEVDWQSLKGIDTIAFYMGIANLSYICENLIHYGKSPDTPIILLQWGTYSRQKTLEGTLATITNKASAVKFQNPAIILVGEIVTFRQKMNWFETKPLFGRQIVLARTSNGESKLASKLIEQGAEVIEFPKWKTVDAPVNLEVIKKLTSYDSIFFSSPESINKFFAIVTSNGLDLRDIKAVFCVQSTKSQSLLNQRGFQGRITDLGEIKHNKLLVVKEVVGNKETGIDNKDYDVLITNYLQVDERYNLIFHQLLDNITLDTAIFPSSRSVDALLEWLKICELDKDRFLENLTIGCLGNHTRQALVKERLKVDVMPETPDTEAFITHLTRLN
ncbi:uroporphyrinogen-III C-methyltransferase [Aquibacillus rhizosphaerae]|uniref:uroporphyrinogen-III C-methyltransferase n=1 Tax=Aquibacillus rhizosphaerae TaxID=3051431 RepID=A0ABT7LER6_9BACI|nr:uroporphyrinogen-III C-methyltransferase [Aquibacillus sp. LR5S19]MDL4843036.1 uroporphyrinogen-III C-methyltransferase [Aquibacillus sp. LR5S19]